MEYLTFGLGVALTAVVRSTKHPFNCTPVLAVSLFAGAKFFKGLGFFGALLNMLISDLILLALGSEYVFGWWTFSVYGSLLITSIISFAFLRPSKNPGKKSFILTTTSSSILFFLVTNFQSWLALDMYQKTFGDLMLAYLNGIPFYVSQFIGDFIFTALIFLTYEGLLSLKNQSNKRPVSENQADQSLITLNVSPLQCD